MSDVFLSYNSADKPAVESLAHRLRAKGIEPWLDKWNLIPGNPWQEEIEQALNKCRSCAVFIGPSGIGPWQNAEMRAAIDRRIGKGGFRVVPVLLPGASRGSHLPTFLTAATWVEFHNTLDDDEQFRRLICGIRGIEPGPGIAKTPANGQCPYRGLNEQAFAVNPTHPPRLAGEVQPVYVSYAWGGESDVLVNEFERRLPENLKLIYDKSAMRPGDWISRFMADIGRADLVLVLLSDKYLRSVYCMRELLYLFNTSLGDRDRLMQRMVPLVVGELKCARARDRDPYVTYWEEEHTTVDALLKKRGWASVGEADRGEWLAIQDFQHRISDMLAWVADTLMPQGAEGVDAAIDLLQQRALTLDK